MRPIKRLTRYIGNDTDNLSKIGLGNSLHVTGVEDGTEVDVFALDGGYIGHGKSNGGTANVELNGADKIVIVNVGNESIKVRRKYPRCS